MTSPLLAPDVLVAPDVLGADWVARTLPLRPDDEGEVVATLVHRAGAPRFGRAVLYVHGFVDYFFQAHLAALWEARGFDFYGLDLRKYGRSLRPHQTPNLCGDLADYDEELNAATAIIRGEHGHGTMVVMGHSTGGLITSLWAHRRRGRGEIDALVHNSPWLDMAGPPPLRLAILGVVHVLGRLRPGFSIPGVDKVYARSLHRSTGGEWDFNLAWKPLDGFPIVAGWMLAVRRGQVELARGLAIDCPILVCASTLTGPPGKMHDALLRSDSVLDAEQIAARSHHLGPDVTIQRIRDGIHDLSLSPKPARGRFFATLFRWVDERVSGAATPNAARISA